MRFSYEAAFGKSSANGYERLLLDAMLGHATLFSRRALFTPAFELGENPMKLVRVRGISKRQNEPRVLSLDECRRLVAQLEEEPFRTSQLLCIGVSTSPGGYGIKADAVSCILDCEILGC